MYPSGHIVHYDMFTPADIYIEDIAHHLAFECRYGGGVRKHYSVAEHSVNVSKRVPQEYAKEALLHDASEAYLKDVTSGLKNMPGMAWYRDIEKHFQTIIYETFGIVSTPESRAAVKYVDDAITLDESLELTADFRPYQVPRSDIKPLDIQITGHKNLDAESLFLYRFRQLFGSKWNKNV
jgi:hypothetical protein